MLHSLEAREAALLVGMVSSGSVANVISRHAGGKLLPIVVQTESVHCQGISVCVLLTPKACNFHYQGHQGQLSLMRTQCLIRGSMSGHTSVATGVIMIL